MVTNRGYEKVETHIAKGRALVMCTKTSQKLVTSVIDSLGILETGLRPDYMAIDTEIYLQRMELEQAYREALVIPDVDAFCVEFIYFDVMMGEKAHVMSSFSLNQKRKLKETRLSGYIAIISHNVAGKQLDICESFGFEVPKGCAPGYKSKKLSGSQRTGWKLSDVSPFSSVTTIEMNNTSAQSR